MERMWKRGKGLCRDVIQNRIENGSNVKLHKKNKNKNFTDVTLFEQKWIMDISVGWLYPFEQLL